MTMLRSVGRVPVKACSSARYWTRLAAAHGSRWYSSVSTCLAFPGGGAPISPTKAPTPRLPPPPPPGQPRGAQAAIGDRPRIGDRQRAGVPPGGEDALGPVPVEAGAVVGEPFGGGVAGGWRGG